MRSQASRAPHATASPVGASGTARAATSVAASGATDLGLLDEGAVERLQSTAGNRATTLAIAAGGVLPALPVQRQDGGVPWGTDEDALRPVNPGALVLAPADPGGDPSSMGYNKLGDAIDYHQQRIDEATATTPEVLESERRIAELKGARAKLAEGALGQAPKPKGRKRDRKAKSPRQMPERPRSLDGSLDLATMAPEAVKREMDLVVAYLAARPPNAERQILMMELPYLEQAAGVVRRQQQQAHHQERLATALSPKGGDEADQLIELLRRIEHAERDRSQEGVWLLHFEGQVLPVSAEELGGLRKQAAKMMRQLGAKVMGLAYDVETAWQDRMGAARKHRVVHALVKWSRDVDDIPASDITRMLDTTNALTRRAYARADAGELVSAANDMVIASNYAGSVAGRVGEWEGELVSGAGRWALALTILKESLSVLAGVGAAGLVAKGGGGMVTMLSTGTKIAGMTTATGLAAGGLGSVAVGGDGVQGMRSGGAAGFGVGINAVTGAAGSLAPMSAVAKEATFAGKVLAVGKAAALDTSLNVASSVAGAGIEGSSMKDAAIGALASAPVNLAGGHLADTYTTGPVVKAIAKGGAGSLAGTAGALAKGDDPTAGAIGGFVGGMYGSAKASSDEAAAAASGPESLLPSEGDIDAHFGGMSEGDLATFNPDGAELGQTPATRDRYGPPAREQAPAAGPAPADSTGATGTTTVDSLGRPTGSGAQVPLDASTASTLGSVTADSGASATGASATGGPAGRNRAGAIDSDLVREPGRPASVPKGAEFASQGERSFTDLGRTGGGTSGARIVADTKTGQKYVFKPVANELEVPRAADRGIEAGDYAPRAKAAEMAADALGVFTPRVELVTIGNEHGSLTEWHQAESLGDWANANRAEFAELKQSPEFRRDMDAIDTLDYLINQVDRRQNLGNYLVEFTPDGTFVRLVPIDNELSFTSTRERAKVGQFAADLPTQVPAEMQARLERLGKDRAAFVEAIKPLVGEEAIPGVLHRLDLLLAHGAGAGRPPA